VRERERERGMNKNGYTKKEKEKIQVNDDYNLDNIIHNPTNETKPKKQMTWQKHTQTHTSTQEHRE
jgi:hypothetical protein